MSEIVWTETATNDLNRHYDFLSTNNPDAAVRAVQTIVSSCEITKGIAFLEL
ncbi:type II toxin-antitoxin system RelE/ParE family toxin [Anabaena azotica]|uniref:type II toxin-antitoxin system RelE/ParE family toxin n=1 Tax=Anabaena azotica TaxID=197653 RepID=UPI0039A5F5E7